jgi:CubicO group peptidase (beta-lactamase class C family)
VLSLVLLTAGFTPAPSALRKGTPESVGLDPAPIDAALTKLHGWLAPGAQFPVPLYGGEVTLLAHDGVIVTHDAAGWALKYADQAGTELPADQQVAMTDDTIFDLASVSKLFTAILVLQEVEADRIDLDEKVAHYLPEYGENGKSEITVKALLTHTSGMQSFLALWRDQPDPAARIHAVLTSTLSRPPGTAYLYSDLNLITLGVLVERLTGTPLDQLVRERITGPLAMVDTGYNPDPAVLGRTAATEFQTDPPRGMVRGSVHDENAWSLGGVAGHAGVFSTAADLAILCQTILDGGTYDGARILGPRTVTQMITNYNASFPGHDHGLGFEINQSWYMGELAGPRTVGHTGFTGTSLVIDFQSRSFAILLTNRIHPDRAWTSPPGAPNMLNSARQEVATALAQALAADGS